jgi:hypothetical protein
MKPGRASHILRAAHTWFRKRPHWKRRGRRRGPRPVSFRISHTVDGRSGRAAHGAANTITYFLCTVGMAALGVGRPRGGVDRAGSRRRAPRPRRDAPGPPGLPASPGTVPTALGRRRCTPPGSQALVHFCAHHTLVTAHTALSTTHGTVPVASRRRRSQPGVGLDLFVCMYSLSPHIVRFKHVSMRW